MSSKSCQTSDKAQKGPGVQGLPKSATLGMVSAPVKGVAMKQPGTQKGGQIK